MNGFQVINADKFLELVLNRFSGNINKWWESVEIIQDGRGGWNVKYGTSYLRDFGWGIMIWDVYGTSLNSPENALLALMKAPVPPSALKKELWQS